MDCNLEILQKHKHNLVNSESDKRAHPKLVPSYFNTRATERLSLVQGAHQLLIL